MNVKKCITVNQSDNPIITVVDVDTDFSDAKSLVEREQFKEATDRFSSKLSYNEDGTVSLLDNTTPQDLQISPELFEMFNEVIDIHNDGVKEHGQDKTEGMLRSGAQHEYVDLGLPSGLKWGTCNIGANAPEEFGDYFAWGETKPKSEYFWSSYTYCTDGKGKMYRITVS